MGSLGVTSVILPWSIRSAPLLYHQCPVAEKGGFPLTPGFIEGIHLRPSHCYSIRAQILIDVDVGSQTCQPPSSLEHLVPVLEFGEPCDDITRPALSRGTADTMHTLEFGRNIKV